MFVGKYFYLFRNAVIKHGPGKRATETTKMSTEDILVSNVFLCHIQLEILKELFNFPLFNNQPKHISPSLNRENLCLYFDRASSS